MHKQLADVQLALVGEIVMSHDLELIADALFNNLVPELWIDYGFKSLKPLASWYEELLERVDFVNSWVDNGAPFVFWMNKFIYP